MLGVIIITLISSAYWLPLAQSLRGSATLHANRKQLCNLIADELKAAAAAATVAAVAVRSAIFTGACLATGCRDKRPPPQLQPRWPDERDDDGGGDGRMCLTD